MIEIDLKRHIQKCFLALVLMVAAAIGGAVPAVAQELLLNRSFETITGLTPAPVNGNNFYLAIANWNAVGTNVLPVNLIRPHAGYAGNPTVTPTGGGAYYFDINSSAGTLRQNVTLPNAGIVDFSAWFSVRDNQQALTGLIINVRNSSDTVVATASTSFLATDPIGLWKQASAANVPLAAGTYTVELVLPNPANVDLASFIYKPPLSITKTSSAVSDPVNGTTLPKYIPGAVVEYLLSIANPGAYTVTLDTLQLVDITPTNLELAIASIGPGPAIFTQGTPTSALTYTFTSLSSTTDDLEFSYDGATTWSSSPSAAAIASGYDAGITHVRFRPKGTMAAGSSFTFRLRYRVK
jgi:hypothetical protein